MPEFVYTVETNYFGEPRLLGVYESSTTEGALTAVQHLMEATPDPGDEWRIKFLAIRTAEEERECLQRCRAHKAIDSALPEDEPVES